MKRSTFITWDELKVGITILVALLIMTVAVYKLGEAANLFTKRYALVTFLPNANGLRVGGTVTVAGQPEGTITAITFLPPDPDTTRNLKVRFEIDRAIQEQVRVDSKARVRTMGLLGDKILDVSPGTPRYPRLGANDTIPADQSLDYEAVISQAAGAVKDMVELTHDLRQITGGIVRGEGTMGQLLTNRTLYDELTTTIARSNQMLAQLQNPNGTFGRMLNDPRLYDELTHTVSATDSLLITLNSERGTVGRLLRDTTLYQSFVGIAQNADSLTRMLTRGNGLASKLLTDQQLYDQLNKLVTDLNAILADVRKNPGRWTKGMIKVF
jgi:phospholipid/cholesterol/gamma-HCH transport system substrate-binding protein